MKNMKSKITNKLCSFFGKPKLSFSDNTKVSLSGLTRQSFFLILLLLLTSCSNIFNKTLEHPSDSKTYLLINPDSVSINSRTISPTAEYVQDNLTGIYLYAKKTKDVNGNSVSLAEKTLAGGTVLKLSGLYRKQLLLEDGAGEYTIRMRAILDNVYFYKQIDNVQIEEGKTNPITIELEPVKGSSDYSEFEDFGGVSVTLNFNKTNVNKIHYKLQDFSNWDSNLGDSGDWAIVDQGDITSFSNISNSSYNSKATYNHLANNTTGSTARLPVGQYRLTFDFLTKDTSLNDFVVINSFPYVVKVEKGRNSYLEENFDLNQVYTITYNVNGGSLALGAKKQTKFTSKHEVNLPNMQKDGFTFQGWYTTSTFETGTGPIENVEQGTTENKTFYAKFADSVIYVDPTTDSTINDGSKDNPVKTLAAAIAKIKAIETTNQSDWLQWYIKVKGTITESLVIALNDDQMALPLKAKGVTFIGASDLINGEPQDVIQGDGTKPVFTIATSTQVSFKNIKITGGKDSQSYDGAGIVMKSGSIVLIEDGTLITGNTASTNGGGIAVCNGANLMLAGGKITGNTCGTDKHGNDIYCSDSGNISVGFNPVVGDLYLPQYNEVNLIDNMTDGASITITPDVYSAVSINEYQNLIGQELISVPSSPMPGMDIIEIKDNNDYFHITPQAGSDIEWFIDDNGYLSRNYTVTFKGAGIETPIIKTVESAATIPLAEDPAKNITRTGYLFAGWTYRAEGSNIGQFVFDNGEAEDYDNKFSHIQSDMEIYAAWICDTDEIHVSVTAGVDIAGLDTSDNLVFGDGSAQAPLNSIQGALEVIKMINNPSRDYTIVINGMTEEYNITIDDTIPAKSITLQGKNEPTAGADPVDGILHGDGMYSNQHNPYQSLLLVSTSTPVILQNIKIDMNVQGYYVDGAALAISSGEVTLEAGATFVGSNDSSIPQGAIAVGDGASLVMNEGALIKGFGIEKGAVYVKTGGSFTMNGGIIKDNKIGDSGAVHVGGGEFIMNGGSISGNTTRALGEVGNTDDEYGAGVCVVSGSFTMNGGYITNNKAYVYNSSTGLTTAGGGVFVFANGTFVMTGGEISGNAAIKADIASPETIIDEDYAYGGGVCLQASGNKLASFTMTGGTISGNTAGTSGNGIGFLGSLAQGATGSISLGGDAIITDNDIYLPSNVTITIVEPMTGGLTPSIRATITPQEYTANQPILNNERVSPENEYDYFAVTPQSDGTITTHWFIDENGKLYKYSVGDLLLTDGTFVYYDESHTFSEDEVSAAVGLVYDLDENGLPRGIIGLKNNGLLPWARQGTTGYNTKFEDIICTPSNDGDTVSFTGDTDGSDNWDYICEIDQTGSADPATNYPAFNYALNYAETAGLTDSDYDSGWYMPSASEMYDISKNLTKINSVLTKIKDINSASAKTLSGYYFWTSSQADAVEVGNSAWYINITAPSDPFTSSNKDWESPSVCCIRKYKKQ